LQENPEGRRGKPAAPGLAATTTIVKTLGTIEESHMLVQNLPRSKNPKQIQDVDCFLCRKLGKECKKGFHVNCFTVFCYRGALCSSRRARLEVVLDSTFRPTVGKPSKFVPQSLENLQLPAERETMYPRANTRIKANKVSNQWRRQQIYQQCISRKRALSSDDNSDST
jgi:hypothetical protein